MDMQLLTPVYTLLDEYADVCLKPRETTSSAELIILLYMAAVAVPMYIPDMHYQVH